MISTITIIALFLGVLGTFMIYLGRCQLKSGVAYTNFAGVWGPITRDGAPIFYWAAVISNFLFGGIMVLVAASMLIG